MPEITFESLKTDVNEFVRELDLAIALMNLSKSFYNDERISEKFDNTYEAHAFVLCRHSVDYSLALSVCRCHDKRDDSHGLSKFFEYLKESTTKNSVQEGILARRMQYVQKEEAIEDTRDHMNQIERARELQVALKSSHQYASVKDFRHKYIAHRGKDKAIAKSTEKEFLYHLVEKTQEIVDLLTGALLGSHEDFEGGSKIWNMYVERFFNVLMAESASE